MQRVICNDHCGTTNDPTAATIRNIEKVEAPTNPTRHVVGKLVKTIKCRKNVIITHTHNLLNNNDDINNTSCACTSYKPALHRYLCIIIRRMGMMNDVAFSKEYCPGEFLNLLV